MILQNLLALLHVYLAGFLADVEIAGMNKMRKFLARFLLIFISKLVI